MCTLRFTRSSTHEVFNEPERAVVLDDGRIPGSRCGFEKALSYWLFSLVLALAGCSSEDHRWVDDEVTFDADGLTIHGTYRHQQGAGPGTCRRY